MNPVTLHLFIPQRDRQDSSGTEKCHGFTKVPSKKKQWLR